MWAGNRSASISRPIPTSSCRITASGTGTCLPGGSSGRFFERYSGERQNTGLFNVCDRPYRDTLAEMAATHRRNYDVWLNGEPPYVFD